MSVPSSKVLHHMSFSHCSKNGELVSLDQAVVPLSNIEYAYGFGVYENIRVRNRHALFLSDHLDRLFNSAELIGLKHSFSKAQIGEYVESLVVKLAGGVFESPLEGGPPATLERPPAMLAQALRAGSDSGRGRGVLAIFS